LAANPNTVGKGGKFGDLKRRLWFLLGALVVYRIGAHIPVPGIDPNVLSDLFNSQQGGILGMFNMFSGGALSRFTIFALGIMPYISASIIMQLMSVETVVRRNMKPGSLTRPACASSATAMPSPWNTARPRVP
jgi:preprotein translocase subunit SecY